MDHTAEEVGQTSLPYNALTTEGLNACIAKMRPMPYRVNLSFYQARSEITIDIELHLGKLERLH